MRKAASDGKKRAVSLSFKLNLLITAIVLVVSLMLINITYHSFTETSYAQIHEQLDTVSLEQIREDPSLLIRCTALYGLTQRDGFAEARAKSAADGNSMPIFSWLHDYWIQYDTGAYLSDPEHETMLNNLYDKALEAGCSPESANDWILENEPEFWMYGDALNFYYSVSQKFVDEADVTGFSHVRLFAEDENGYMLLADSIPAVQQNDAYDRLMDYGEYVDRAPCVDAYKEQHDQKYVSYKTDKGPETAKVMSAEVKTSEGKTVRLYFAYCCDSAKVEEGRRDFLLRSLLLMALMVIAAIVVSILILRRMATKPLRQLAAAVNEFGLGQENGEKREITELNIKSKDEIGDLYRNIRSMQGRILEDADNLTRMTAEKERISTELDLATQIQASMLPRTFPPFPERKEFDVFASMDPAKEVGGDFYDFFLIDKDHLGLVIADVSGKGIPAALFMTVSKAMIKNCVMSGQSPAAALESVNRQICANNQEEMFVTVWVGVLEISTGKLTAANAGHEYPAFKSPDGDFTLYKDVHGLVVGWDEEVAYQEYELQLTPGAKLFVYTDGVPEATDRDNEMFGCERMLAALNECADRTPEEILRHVRSSVEAFVGDAEQFDDITMLCLGFGEPGQE